MGTANFEIQALTAWIQVTVVSSYYNYNEASLQPWWFMAFCLTVQAFVLDLFLLSGLYGKSFSRKADYYANLTFQKVVIALVALHGYTLYSLTRKELVNCPFNSFIVFPFGVTFYKYDFLNAISSLVLSFRITRFVVLRLLARGERNEEEDVDGEKEEEWKEEDILKVPLLGVV